MSRMQCKNCHLFHQQGRQCPNLTTEIHLRLALDDVKTLSGGDPAKVQQNREILQNLLKAKRQGSAGEAAGPPAQPSPQPHLVPLPLATQEPQQQHARLAAPPQSEDGSGSDGSTSEEESESESESEEEEISGPNAGSEQQADE